VTTINGKIAKHDTIVRNGDRIENVVHRHEPPVTSKPVKILHEDGEREFIVIDKPGSIVRMPRSEALRDLTVTVTARFVARPRDGALFLSLTRGDPTAGVSVPEGLQ
jgi:23S rRNA-/tRNA-specific pseudouridylate synthase